MIDAYTDGSCLGNPGPGGWAYLINTGPQIENAGGKDITTNNVMDCLLYTSPSPRDKRQSRMPSSA